MRTPARLRVPAAALAASVLLAILGAAPMAAGTASSTWYVDDDGTVGATSCDGSTSVGTIQDVIDASGVDDTIRVCPGTYPQWLHVGNAHDGLTLEAVSRWTATIAPEQGVAPTDAYLLHVDGANHVRVTGLRFVAPTAAECNQVTALIYVQDADGSVIRGNRFAPMGPTSLGPCGYSEGINLDNVTGAFVSWNLVRDFKSFGIAQVGSSGVIKHNSVRYFHPAYDYMETTAQGIYSSSASGALRISGNVVRGAPGAGSDAVAISTAISVGFGGTFPLVIRDNVTRYTTTSIAFGFMSRMRVKHNDGVGIGIDSGISAALGGNLSIYGNHMTGFARGVRATDTTGDIHFRMNDFRGNINRDCVDQSEGDGTAGTANVWVHNLGDESSPHGICSPGA
ncbi:MAG: hypothetical protein QOH61_561 [Chloroflexota bacterium]|jgi:hypothetical protein|nr:hypothetical protein [Chloroflexota bacterium]